MVICKEPPPRLTLIDLERTIMSLIKAGRKIAELEALAANAQPMID